MERKICSKCKKEKSRFDFNVSSRNKNGLRGECRDCQKICYKSNSEYYKQKRKKRYSEDRDKELIRNKKYYENNKSKIIQGLKEKKRINVLLRISSNLRSRISQFVKSNKIHKDNKTMVMLGINLPKFKKHIEKKFYDGMCWENYGEWVIDHIIPLYYAKTPEDLNELCHYTNLQPMWAKENSSKRNRIL